MRVWRVGTISMGISLVFLGVFLLLTQFLHWDISTVLKVWWPIILVVLGIEILWYLYASKQEKPYVSFDLLSIIFVGLLGTAGILMVFLQSTGLLDVIEHGVSREEVTKELPAFDYKLDDSVERIVFESTGGNNPITIEGTEEKQVSVFGTYRTALIEEEILKIPEDYLFVTKKGDTLFIQLKELPRRTSDFYTDYPSVQATILIPHSMRVEIKSNYDEVTMLPRNLQTNWSVDGASIINLDLKETENVKVSVKNTDIMNKEEHTWKHGDKEEGTHSVMQIGKELAGILIMNSRELYIK